MTANRYDQMADAIGWLIDHAEERPSLRQAADAAAMSPFHYQRVFSEWVGLSPARFLQVLTRQHLASLLQEPLPLEAIADEAGLSGLSRVHDLFVTLEAMTPEEYRHQAAGLDIDWGVHDTRFGQALLAATGRGLCAMLFVEKDDDPRALLEARWPRARLHESPQATADLAAQLFTDTNLLANKLPLLVRGTNFQVKVWEALLQIPYGQVTTYQRIAQTIGRPTASRAVGQAVGANPIGYLIPCHRVIQATGCLGSYRWDTKRKASLLAWEHAAASANRFTS